MNTQPVEKRITNSLLQVHSVFHTIQGEGPFAGTPAVFVRLAGCNLQCPGCDTDYTSNREHLPVFDIIQGVAHARLGSKTKLVVITGGEPFRQDIGRLINTLIDEGYFVQIETNGTLPPSPDVQYSSDYLSRTGAFIICSPKTGSMNPMIAKLACAFKYVIEADSVNDYDGLPNLALQHSANPCVARPPYNSIKPVYLQPMDSGYTVANTANIEAALKSCMKYGYILQLQIHKILGVE